MKVISLFDSGREEYWISQIQKSEWDSSNLLCKILKMGAFHDTFGSNSKMLLLTDGDELVSYCTYAKEDDIPETDLEPWMGFVYTFEKYRGHRYVGLLMDEVIRLAGEENYSEFYISTTHIGLYEKYGCEYLTGMVDFEGEPTRVYVKKI